jgi:hypothetical protein
MICCLKKVGGKGGKGEGVGGKVETKGVIVQT